MKTLRTRLTFANVTSCLALFIALGGASYAATQLPKDSVGAKQLMKNAVTTAKVKKEAITAAKVKKGTLTGKQINLAKLGTVPSATHAASADSIPQAEATHIVGAPGQPGFENGAENLPLPLPGISYPPVGFYKDAFGVVHLEGEVKMPAPGVAFTLPPGYRPASGTLLVFEEIQEHPVLITGSAVGANPAGGVFQENTIVQLSGITYRAGS
jgi:hypothetical protein